MPLVTITGLGEEWWSWAGLMCAKRTRQLNRPLTDDEIKDTVVLALGRHHGIICPREYVKIEIDDGFLALHPLTGMTGKVDPFNPFPHLSYHVNEVARFAGTAARTRALRAGLPVIDKEIDRAMYKQVQSLGLPLCQEQYWFPETQADVLYQQQENARRLYRQRAADDGSDTDSTSYVSSTEPETVSSAMSIGYDDFDSGLQRLTLTAEADPARDRAGAPSPPNPARDRAGAPSPPDAARSPSPLDAARSPSPPDAARSPSPPAAARAPSPPDAARVPSSGIQKAATAEAVFTKDQVTSMMAGYVHVNTSTDRGRIGHAIIHCVGADALADNIEWNQEALKDLLGGKKPTKGAFDPSDTKALRMGHLLYIVYKVQYRAIAGLSPKEMTRRLTSNAPMTAELGAFGGSTGNTPASMPQHVAQMGPGLMGVWVGEVKLPATIGPVVDEFGEDAVLAALLLMYEQVMLLLLRLVHGKEWQDWIEDNDIKVTSLVAMRGCGNNNNAVAMTYKRR